MGKINKIIEELEKAGHKYIKREGAPGHYRYTYEHKNHSIKVKDNLGDMNGSSYKAETKPMPFEHMKQLLGEPHSTNDKDSKVKNEWHVKVGGHPLSVYDYKEDGKSKSEYSWHIGGYDKEAANILKDFIESKKK